MNGVLQIPDDVVRDRQEVVERARALKITDQPSYDYAAESLAWAAELEKKITTHYEPFRLSTKAAYDSVLESKKNDLEPVLEVKRILSRATAAFDLEQERIRLEAQRKQDEEAAMAAEEKRRLELKNAKELGATKEELREMKAAPITFVSPTVDPTHRRSQFVSKPIKRWSAEVLGEVGFMFLVKAVAVGKVPLSLLLPNQTALNKLAGTFKDKLNIPGVKAVCEHTTSVKGTV